MGHVGIIFSSEMEVDELPWELGVKAKEPLGKNINYGQVFSAIRCDGLENYT